MASYHCRSNSFPSQSHPAINDVEDRLERLKASSQATCSTSSSICANLASLSDLHESINNMIQMPSIQQSISQEQGQINNWINELLEGSLRLVDLCGFSRDIVQSTKESVQELESSIRRKSQDMDAYAASRKKITKMISKFVKNNNLKMLSNFSSSNQADSLAPLPAIAKMLKEAESLNLSILKSVLMLFSSTKLENKKSSWSSSLLSKFTQRVHSSADCDEEDLCSLSIHKSSLLDSKNMLKQLKTSEMSIHEIEGGLEALFRCLVKTRVSLLNVFTH